MKAASVLRNAAAFAKRKAVASRYAVRTGRGILRQERRREKDPVRKFGMGWLLLTSFTPKRAILSAFKAKHPSMYRHSMQVAQLSVEVAKELRSRGVNPGVTNREMRLGAVFHDIGKLFLSKKVVTKKPPLTKAERAAIDSHVNLGVRLVKDIVPEKSLELVLKHQEEFDGSGYPKGIKADEIPLSVRIISLVDDFSAMSMPREYRSSTKSWRAAFDEIKSLDGKRYDLRVIAAFEAVLEMRGML